MPLHSTRTDYCIESSSHCTLLESLDSNLTTYDGTTLSTRVTATSCSTEDEEEEDEDDEEDEDTCFVVAPSCTPSLWPSINIQPSHSRTPSYRRPFRSASRQSEAPADSTTPVKKRHLWSLVFPTQRTANCNDTDSSSHGESSPTADSRSSTSHQSSFQYQASSKKGFSFSRIEKANSIQSHQDSTVSRTTESTGRTQRFLEPLKKLKSFKKSKTVATGNPPDSHAPASMSQEDDDEYYDKNDFSQFVTASTLSEEGQGSMTPSSQKTLLPTYTPTKLAHQTTGDTARRSLRKAFSLRRRPQDDTSKKNDGLQALVTQAKHRQPSRARGSFPAIFSCLPSSVNKNFKPRPPIPMPTTVAEFGPYLGPQREEHLGRHTLVLDLDETLVHSSFVETPTYSFAFSIEVDNLTHSIYVAKRPGVDQFLKAVATNYEVILFTASLALYADPLMDRLDPDGLCIVRLFREQCVIFNDQYVKDLSRIGRDLKKTVILDNSPHAYAFQPENAIPIESWFDDPSDDELIQLIPLLTSLVEVDDLPTAIRTSVRCMTSHC